MTESEKYQYDDSEDDVSEIGLAILRDVLNLPPDFDFDDEDDEDDKEWWQAKSG